MEVVIHSTLNSVQGRVVVATDPGQTVDSLITAFCIEKGTPHKKHYVLRNKDLAILNNTKKIGASEIQSGDVLYLGLQETNEEWGCGCNQWWLLSAVALLIGCGGLVAITILHIQQNQIEYEYGAVIDAGSSHSQIYVYRWAGGKKNGTAIPETIFTQRTTPGISNFTDRPEDAGESLKPELEGARTALGSTDLSDTPLYLGATAGMRLLNASDKATSDAIMNDTRYTMAQYGFQFSDPMNQAQILEGMDEGAFSWVQANYLSGVFQELTNMKSLLISPNAKTKGALDLGGASTQITFVPEHELGPNMTGDTKSLTMYGTTYDVYTHSYLCYGVNEAYRQYQAELVLSQNYSDTVDDPCRPFGNSTTESYAVVFEAPCTINKSRGLIMNKTFTFVGSSDFEKCQNAVNMVFNFTPSCDNPPCAFDGISQPPVFGEFLAFSGFYYTMSFLNVTTKAGPVSLPDFTSAYSTYCAKNWSEVAVIQGKDQVALTRFCFEAVYIHTLLMEGYKFDNTTWKNINFINKVGPESNELGWALGYMLNISNSIPVSMPPQRISTVLFVLLVVLFGVFLAVSVGFACHAINQKKQQSQYQRMSTYGSL